MQYVVHQTLLRAIIMGDSAPLLEFFKRGGSCDATDHQGTTLLMEAALHNQFEIARLLLQRGAQINLQNRDCLTALHFALERPDTLPPRVITPAGHVGYPPPSPEQHSPHATEQLVRLLLDYGADPNASPYRDSLTMRSRNRLRPPLQLAIVNGYDQLVVVLIEAGANINQRDPLDRTPLLEACESNHPEMAARLLALGATPGQPRHDGRTPLHSALLKLADALQHEQTLRRRNHIGAVLDAAARKTQQWRELIKALLATGANPDFLDLHCTTPLMVALRHGLVDATGLLLEAGAEPDLDNTRGTSPLRALVIDSRADDDTREALARLLLQHHGAELNAQRELAQEASIRGLPRLADALKP